MSNRDELAKLIQREYIRAIDRKRPQDCWDAPADAIVAAGYRKPRTIPDTHLCSDSDGSYPVDHKAGTIVQSADGSVWRFDEGDWDNLDWGSATLRGPATVLYEPEAKA